MEAVIQPGNENNVHHMILYECYAPNSDETYGPFLNQPPKTCHTDETPVEYYDCMMHYAFTWVR